MIGKLFGSNSRVKILKLFLFHPENKYYIRQIARDLKLQVNSVRRELENLEKFGLLKSNMSKGGEDEKGLIGQPADLMSSVVFGYNLSDDKSELDKKNEKVKTVLAGRQEKKFFQVNTDFILYEETRALIIKAQILYEKDFIDKLLKIGKPKLLILSGIFVNNPNAKVDMLLVGRFNKEKIKKLINELEHELSREINYTIMEATEFIYRRDMTDIFLYDILESKKIIIIDEIGLG